MISINGVTWEIGKARAVVVPRGERGVGGGGLPSIGWVTPGQDRT